MRDRPAFDAPFLPFGYVVLRMSGTGTIFDSVWFAPERPAFRAISNWSSPVLSVVLLMLAGVAIFAALNPRTPATVKAIMIAYAVLP